LNAMQVALAAVATGNVPAGGQFDTSWNSFSQVSGWFAVAVLLFVASVILFLGLEFGFMLAREVSFAGKDLWRKRRN
jgi:hypothetical protein